MNTTIIKNLTNQTNTLTVTSNDVFIFCMHGFISFLIAQVLTIIFIMFFFIFG